MIRSMHLPKEGRHLPALLVSLNRNEASLMHVLGRDYLIAGIQDPAENSNSVSGDCIVIDTPEQLLAYLHNQNLPEAKWEQ